MDNKKIIFGGLIAILVMLGVAYAAFNTQLMIEGTASINSKWDVHIQNIEVASTTNKAENITDSTKVVSPTQATFGTNLVKPGDSITYDVTVVNEGTLPAKLETITFKKYNSENGVDKGTEVTQEMDANNPIVISYDGISENDTLIAKTGTKTFQVTVTYNDATTKQPSADKLHSLLEMTLNFVQDK